MQIVRTTYLSLGSNLGNKTENLQQAIDLIAEKIGNISKISSVYKTAAWEQALNFIRCQKSPLLKYLIPHL